MENKIYDVIVVGAGVGGLSASYHLKKYGLNHIVFERGKIGESWRSQRWDSFRMNTPNKLNVLPGSVYKGSDTGGFDEAAKYISSFEEHVSAFDLPVLENSKVISVEKPGEFFDVIVSVNNKKENYSSRQVIVASGHASEIKTPSFAKNIPGNIRQLHTSEYRNPAQLPGGAVLVVGSAQSGVQIAEDLADAGRQVYLSTSMVARVPRWYRGRDIVEWLIDMKFFEARAQDLEDPKMLEMRPPQITGVGGNKYTISLQSLAKKGVTIVGKTDNADGQNVFFQPNAAMHVKFADGFSKKVKEMIDGFILKTQAKAESAEFDEADQPDENASCANPMNSLNLQEKNINTIIWSTGFNGDFSYIKLPVFDEQGHLKHKDGIPVFPGLYFIGYPWLTARKSALIFGIKEDAAFVVNKIHEQSTAKSHSVPVAV
jgi:putative flavoprotein involved in K+ transport